MSIDVQHLANLPGYGSAKVALVKNDLWDEYAGLPEKKWRVQVEYSVRDNATEVVYVTARTKEEADEKGSMKVCDGCEFRIEIEDVEVSEE